MKALLISCLGLLCGTALAAPVAAPGSAAHLVGVMQLDRSTLLGMQASMHTLAAQGKVSAERARCVDALPPGALSDTYARIVHQVLNADEIAEADRFFSSDTGAKIVAEGVVSAKKQYGLPVTEAAPALTPADDAAVDRFSQTGAGKKLLADKVLESDSAMKMLKDGIGALVSGCKG